MPRGYTDIVRILLDSGADLNALDEAGTTPLFWAQKIGRQELISLLQDPKYAKNGGRRGDNAGGGRQTTVFKPSEYNIDYPMWWCCTCSTGPNRARFHKCRMGRGCGHERCEKCMKVAAGREVDENAPIVPEEGMRWNCCVCGDGLKKMDQQSCGVCEHGRCERCWVVQERMLGGV
jgi:hypothetical protein